MRGIKIKKVGGSTSVHTGSDLGLIQEKKEIGMPEVRSYSVDVPGRDGLINLTKADTGVVNYKNRALSFQYFYSGLREELLQMRDKFVDLHGETIEIVDDDTPDYYYTGECSISFNLGRGYLQIMIDVDAQPFMTALSDTVVVGSATSSKPTTFDDGTKLYPLTVYNPGRSTTFSISAPEDSFWTSMLLRVNDSDTLLFYMGQETVIDYPLQHGINTIYSLATWFELTIKFREVRI